MHILEVMELEEVPPLPVDYVPSQWVLRVAAELERRMRLGQKMVLVGLYDRPSFRSVGRASTL